MSQDDLKAKGTAAARGGNHQEAVDWYTKAIAVDPNVEAAGALYSNRAASYTALKQFDKAVLDGGNCARVRPQWFKGHFRRGEALANCDRLAEALESYEAALSIGPSADEGKDIRKRMDKLHSEMKERTQKAGEFKAKGTDAARGGNHQEAIHWYSQAIQVDPNVEAAGALYSNRAASYTAMKQFDKAVTDGEHCTRVRPQWFKGYFRKGVALEAMGRLDEALRAFGGSEDAKPNNDEMNDVQERSDTLRSAIKERNAAATTASMRSAKEAKMVGSSLFSTGKYELATTFFNRALELAAKDSSVTAADKASFLCNRAACSQQIQDYNAAINDANAALEYVPGHVKALLRRAIAREGLEKWKLALDDYIRINELSPGDSNVSQGVTRCQRAIRQEDAAK